MRVTSLTLLFPSGAMVEYARDEDLEANSPTDKYHVKATELRMLKLPQYQDLYSSEKSVDLSSLWVNIYVQISRSSR